MGMGFNFEQHRLGLWDLSWDKRKTIYWEMGLGPPFMTLSSENISETTPEYLMLVQKYQVIRNKGRRQDNVWHS